MCKLHDSQLKAVTVVKHCYTSAIVELSYADWRRVSKSQGWHIKVIDASQVQALNSNGDCMSFITKDRQATFYSR